MIRSTVGMLAAPFKHLYKRIIMQKTSSENPSGFADAQADPFRAYIPEILFFQVLYLFILFTYILNDRSTYLLTGTESRGSLNIALDFLHITVECSISSQRIFYICRDRRCVTFRYLLETPVSDFSSKLY